MIRSEIYLLEPQQNHIAFFVWSGKTAEDFGAKTVKKEDCKEHLNPFLHSKLESICWFPRESAIWLGAKCQHIDTGRHKALDCKKFLAIHYKDTTWS